MKIEKCGRYRLTQAFSSRGPISIVHLRAGMTIRIAQIDSINNRVIGPDLMDWMDNDLPVEEAPNG